MAFIQTMEVHDKFKVETASKTSNCSTLAGMIEEKSFFFYFETMGRIESHENEKIREREKAIEMERTLKCIKYKIIHYSIFYAWLSIHIGFGLHVCDRRAYRFDFIQFFIDIYVCFVLHMRVCVCVCGARVCIHTFCTYDLLVKLFNEREREREREKL